MLRTDTVNKLTDTERPTEPDSAASLSLSSIVSTTKTHNPSGNFPGAESTTTTDEVTITTKALRFLNTALIKSFIGFEARLALCNHSPETYQKLAEKLAMLEALRAYQTTRGYREFLGPEFRFSNFSDIPETSKASYIKKFYENDPLALYVNDRIPAGASWDTSTGTSGKATHWYRGINEVNAAHRIISHRAEAILAKQPYVFINGFALGPWATGMTAARGVGQDKKAITYNTNSNPELMLETIQEARRLNPQLPIVVAGYPPHMEDLINIANEKGRKINQGTVLCVVGGEAMSELQRSRLIASQQNQNGFSDVFSFYGASDLDINIGFETQYEVELRRALIQNPKLAKSLLGENYPFVPMIFKYDPMTHLIEVNKHGQLLFTENTGLRISPRIRYNLGDSGNIKTLDQVNQALIENNIELNSSPITKLPLVFVYGRIDDGITYRGANFAWENIEESIQLLDLNNLIKNYGIAQYEQDGKVRTEILLHARDQAAFQELNSRDQNLLSDFLTCFSRLNHDLAFQLKAVRNISDYPTLRIFLNESPMSLHQKENPHRKQKHVFFGDEIQQFNESVLISIKNNYNP